MMQHTLERPDVHTQTYPSPRWQFVVIGLLVLVVAAMSVYIWQMRMPAEGSDDVYFARDMSAHHEQAVEMATIMYDRGPADDLKVMTKDIMFTQHGQIGQMQGWLTVWGETISGSGPPMGGMGQMMGMASYDQVQSLNTLPLPEAEVQFLQLMIRHHQGGVEMAQEIVNKTRRPEVVRLAQAIIAAQQSEITAMTAMLAKRGAQPLAPLAPMSMPLH